MEDQSMDRKIPGFHIRKAIGKNLACQHPMHNPIFPYWVCTDCGSQIYAEQVRLERHFDPERFMRAIIADSQSRLEPRINALVDAQVQQMTKAPFCWHVPPCTNSGSHVDRVKAQFGSPASGGDEHGP
jgi:hypothetical protein